MENKKVKKYVINFAEKTLNQCPAFTSVYGKKFARQRLSVNLEKVYTDMYSRTSGGEYNTEDSSMKLYKMDESSGALTITDIKKNWELQQIVLHESIHAVFKRTKEECEKLGIRSGTGTVEVYHNGEELGRGLNEGLTEWISEKAGYRARAYGSEYNIISMLELAIGEKGVMQLARGDIKGNIAQLLHMSEEECVELLKQIDYIYKEEQNNYQIQRIITALSKIKNEFLTNANHEELAQELGVDYDRYLHLLDYYSILNRENIKEKGVKSQITYLASLIHYNYDLDTAICNVETTLFKKFFKSEIEEAQSAKTISPETMQRMSKLQNSIHGGNAYGSTVWERIYPLKFKNQIFKQIEEKYMATNLPAVQKKGWFQKAKQFFNKIYMRRNSNEIPLDLPIQMTSAEENKSNGQNFKDRISDMSNYSQNDVAQPTAAEDKEVIGEAEIDQSF